MTGTDSVATYRWLKPFVQLLRQGVSNLISARVLKGGYKLPKLEKVGLGWATFQMLRKTNASLSKKVGVDPKMASDQRGHGLGVSMEIYTSSDMEQKRAAVKQLEAAVLRKPQPEGRSAEAKSA